MKTYQPQSKYANAEGLALNRSGAGSFCRFRVRSDVRGQEQNRYLNKRILGCASRGWQVDAHFIETDDRETLEHALICAYDPRWNRVK